MLAFTLLHGGKNKLEEKKSTLQGASHTKKIYKGKNQNSSTLQGY
jgi:hypothetical protein